MRDLLDPLTFLILCFIVAVVFVLPGCDRDFERKQRISEANEKIARACTPELGQQRIMQWTVGSEGHYVLFLTIREPLAHKGNVAQFLVVDEREIQ